MTPSRDSRAFWGFEDLALFVGAVFPAWLLGALLIRLGRTLAPGAFSNDTVRALAFQSAIYALLIGALYMVITVRYRRPLWQSLGWVPPERGAWWCVFGGPALAIGLSTLGVALGAPEIPTPVENLISGRGSLFLVAFFAVVLGPLFEELLFRGFLQPLLHRVLGAWPAIILAATGFALLHGPQYMWSWKHLLLIGLAGVAFGYARYKSGSTAAAALLHAGYNLTYFVGYLIQSRETLHLTLR
ncbi:MAG: Abortive infection protein [Bryobacterales bacterium]|nr:Abortive infection protein [Bryobacterales bacterium]